MFNVVQTEAMRTLMVANGVGAAQSPTAAARLFEATDASTRAKIRVAMDAARAEAMMHSRAQRW
jgi:hypothetical protein